MKNKFPIAITLSALFGLAACSAPAAPHAQANFGAAGQSIGNGNMGAGASYTGHGFAEGAQATGQAITSGAQSTGHAISNTVNGNNAGQ